MRCGTHLIGLCLPQHFPTLACGKAYLKHFSHAMDASISQLSTSYGHTHLTTLSQPHSNQCLKTFLIPLLWQQPALLSAAMEHPPLTVSLWEKHPHLTPLPPPTLLLIIWIYPPSPCGQVCCPTHHPAVVEVCSSPSFPCGLSGWKAWWWISRFKMAAP